jgi:hypothetical protein
MQQTPRAGGDRMHAFVAGLATLLKKEAAK